MSAHVSATGWWTVGPSCSTTSLSVHSTRQLTPELSPSWKHETSWDAPNITRLKDPPANIANCIVESLSWWMWPLLDGMKFRAYSRLHKAPLHLDITWHNSAQEVNLIQIKALLLRSLSTWRQALSNGQWQHLTPHLTSFCAAFLQEHPWNSREMTWKGGARSNNRSTTQLCQVMWQKLKRGPRQTSQRMRSASQRLLNVHRGIPVCCGVFPNHPMCSRSSRYFNNWMCCKYRWICWGLLRSAKHFTAGTWKTIFTSWGWFLGGSQRNTDLPKVQENLCSVKW